MKSLKFIKLPVFKDERGNLTVLELDEYIKFPIKRVYFLTDVSQDRGGHAVKKEKKIYICQKGSVKAKFHDGKKWHFFDMNGPSDALIMEKMMYREFHDFSKDAVLLALSSVKYNPKDYIYNLEEFIKFVNK